MASKKIAYTGVVVDGPTIKLYSDLENGDSIYAIAKDMFPVAGDFKRLKVKSLTLEFEENEAAWNIFNEMIERSSGKKSILSKVRRVMQLLVE